MRRSLFLACTEPGDGFEPGYVFEWSEDESVLGSYCGISGGFGWVVMGIGIGSLFERRPWSYVLVNGGYLTVALVVMGAILGGWRQRRRILALTPA
jgi:Protein of unknown function (DUF1761)